MFDALAQGRRHTAVKITAIWLFPLPYLDFFPFLDLRKPPQDIAHIRNVDDELAQRLRVLLFWQCGHVFGTDLFYETTALFPIFIRGLHRFQQLDAQIGFSEEETKMNRQFAERAEIKKFAGG